MTRISDIGRWLVVLVLAATPLALLNRPTAPRRTVASDQLGLTIADTRLHGAVVTSLRSGGLAERGGLAVGDEIRGVDGHPVRAAAATRYALHQLHGCHISIDLRRGGHRLVATIGRCGREGSQEGGKAHGA
jgi:S1-C subfamily serine protease